MKRKVLSAACAVMLCISLTACGGADIMSQIAGSSNKWVDSDLIGTVPADAEIRLQDDFAAAINQEWKNEVGDQFRGTFQDAVDNVFENKKQIVTDESIPGATAECIRTYYGLASNWDDRAEDGYTPLKPYIEDIESISSMDEMYNFIEDPQRNPLFLGPITTDLNVILQSEKDKDGYAVGLVLPELSLTVDGANQNYLSLDSSSSFEEYERVCEKTEYLLGKLGYSDKEIDETIEGCMKWEKKLAAYDGATANMIIPTYTRDELYDLAGDFPMEKIITSWGFGDAEYFCIDTAYAKKLDSICKEGNLKNIKAFLIVNYCLQSAQYLDKDTYDKMEELDLPKGKKAPDTGETPEQLENELMFDTYIGESPMVGAMNQVYVENYFDDSAVEELNSITKDVIDGYKYIFTNEDWLSEEGKAACIEKLDAIKIHVAYQDFDSVDYSNLELKSHEEGGSFLEAYFESRRFEMDHLNWLSTKIYDRDYWDPMDQSFSTTITNAAYMMRTNGIYIFAGVIVDPIYTMDMTYEEKLAKLFTIVGHEITHGFDKDGSQFDKEGNFKKILTTDDLKEFNDRNDNVASYYTTLSPFKGASMVTGSNINGEATADMGGIKVTLYLASLEDDFDYDLYFRSFAEMWRENVTLEREKKQMAKDVHPLDFYRINVGLQQFDEFYETYGIKEGDGMYLAPDDRIKVW